MSFIVVLIALLIERFFNCAHLRSWRWYDAYQQKLAKRLTTLAPYWQLAAILVPALIIVFIVTLLLQGVLFGLLSFLFALFIVLYCFGPRNLWADSYAQAVSEPANAEPTDLHQFFIAAHTRLFSVIFWYVILGPVAAVLYRMIALSSEPQQTLASPTPTTPAYFAVATKLKAIVEWIPVRIFTFCFALGGHFVQTFSVWRKQVFAGLDSNDAMLTDCGLAALGNGDEVAVEKSAISLLDRVFVIVLVVIAVVTLIF